MKYKVAWMLLVLLFVGCGDASQVYYTEYEGESSERGEDGVLVPTDTSLMLGTHTLWSAEQVGQAVHEGVIRLPAPSPARAIRVVWGAGLYDQVTYAVERADGSISAYEELSSLSMQERSRTSDVLLDEPATALLLRVESADVSFVQARFFREEPVGGMYTHPMPGEGGTTREEGEWALQQQGLALPERYQAPQSILNAAAMQNIKVDRAAPGCIGYSTSGALRLKADLKAKFPGISHIDNPYVCRSTANGGRSLHAQGRALDLFIQTVGADHEDNANNAVGDPIANWLIANAHVLGVQSVIWDRSIWTPGSGLREYCKNCWRNKKSPHNDHIHIGLNLAAAAEMTPYFGNPGMVTNPPTTAPIGPPVQCRSASLGRDVPAGTCVQSTSQSNRCKWFQCSSQGSWTALGDMPTGCSAASHAADVCMPVTPKPEIRVRLEWTEETDLDLYVREPSGDVLSYRSNEVTTNDGVFSNEESCRRGDCSNLAKPFHEDAVWGQSTGTLTSGAYTFWVVNFDGRASANAKVIVTRTNENGDVTFEQSVNVNLASTKGAKFEERTISIP